MARQFAPGDTIECDVGACAPVGSGAYTMVWLYQIPLFAGVGGLGALRRSGTYAREALVTGGKWFGAGDFSSGFGTSPEAPTWTWVAQRKSAGAAHYEWAYAAYPVADPDTDIIFGEAPDAANHGDPGAGDEVWIGMAEVQATRKIAVMAMFSGRLSDATIKTIFTTRLLDLMNASPVGCWPLNQADIADDVIDVTGAGADQNAITGTTVVADPPGYDYDLAPETAVLTGSIPMQTAALVETSVSTSVLAGSIPMQTAALTESSHSEASVAGSIPMQTFSALVTVPFDTPPTDWLIGQGLPVWQLCQA